MAFEMLMCGKRKKMAEILVMIGLASILFLSWFMLQILKDYKGA